MCTCAPRAHKNTKIRVKGVVGAVGMRPECACKNLRKDRIATEDVRRSSGGSVIGGCEEINVGKMRRHSTESSKYVELRSASTSLAIINLTICV
jgi:hypothetical protein